MLAHNSTYVAFSPFQRWKASKGGDAALQSAGAAAAAAGCPLTVLCTRESAHKITMKILFKIVGQTPTNIATIIPFVYEEIEVFQVCCYTF